MNIEKTLRVKSVAGDTSFQQTALLGVTLKTPDSFGYSVEINANINVLSLASVGGKLGANYVVYTKGKYAWFPYLYAYAGYSLNVILQKGLKKKDIMDSFKKLTTKTSILKWLKTNAGVGVGISPFAAVLYNTENEIKPTSWEKWFTAITASVKLKAGLGFSVGGSMFAGGDDGWEPGLAVDINLVKDRKVWFGGTLDIGAGAGTPAIDIGVNYASYFWLLDDNKVYAANSWFFYYRWYTFINFNPNLNLPEIFAKVGIKLYKYISDALSIVPNISDRYNLQSIEDYENHPRRELIDSDFQLAILSKGYDDEFFAQLDNETLGGYELV
jgi:hypothetical protein